MSENVMPLLSKLHSKADALDAKLETIDHNVLAAVERLDKISDILEQEGTAPNSLKIDKDALKETLGIPNTKHMDVGIEYIGLHEVKDNKVLTAFLGIDPHTTYWCAYYAKACYDNAGMKSGGGVAHDYTDILKRIEEPVFGCACIWKNHIAFFYGYADRTKLSGLAKYGKVNSLEQWEAVKCEKDNPHAVVMVLGGNQSDMCNISPKSFYDNYTDFDGYYENVA